MMMAYDIEPQLPGLDLGAVSVYSKKSVLKDSKVEVAVEKSLGSTSPRPHRDACGVTPVRQC